MKNQAGFDKLDIAGRTLTPVQQAKVITLNNAGKNDESKKNVIECLAKRAAAAKKKKK